MAKKVNVKVKPRNPNGWFLARLRVLRGRPTDDGDGVKLKIEVDLNKRATMRVSELFLRRMT